MCAQRVARQLVMQGCSIILAEVNESQDAPERRQWLQSYAAGGASTEILTGAQLIACSGFIGNFSAEFEMRGKKTIRQASTIVIAEDTRRQTNLKDVALSAGPSIRSLSEFVNDLDNDSHAFADMQVTFLNGLHRESEPVIAAEVMRCASTLQTLPGTRAHVMTGNLKVAGTGLETLYRQAKASGALFFKFTDSSPNILPGDNTDWIIEFRDEITGHQYRRPCR